MYDKIHYTHKKRHTLKKKKKLFRAGTEMEMWRRDMWTKDGKRRVG